ncbi:FixH family protein [Radiobacillus kanasensis]|uniref:FixH family protein n=1 Tax=Radiobacillus kanasensis TaxID=2844358 RepID=UPI001E47E9CA|nr:FixH family protein [Radiobacillus kanasensis]UFU01419.1 FixH family protein [Radiobacillus kanasensis]
MKKILVLILFVLVLSACSENQSETTDDTSEVEMIDASLQVPEEGMTGEEISLQVKVTQGEEVVTDAEEVVFEIWPAENKEESTKVTASLQDEAYVATYTFGTAGTYSVQSHVTARGLHTMPIKEISIMGSDSMEESAPEEGHDHASEESSPVTLELTESEYKANEEATIIVEALQGEEHITGAKVSLEIATPDHEKHVWLDLEEKDNGYQGSYTFSKTGQATVTIHYMNGDAHDHNEVQITIN